LIAAGRRLDEHAGRRFFDTGIWPRNTSARRAEKRGADAYARDSTRVFAKRAVEVAGELRIVADPPVIVPVEDLPGATVYARFCGATVARGHARRGDRIGIASHLGQGDEFDRAIAKFSTAYADQNERDYQHSPRPSAPEG
jgi:hypothetical protein